MPQILKTTLSSKLWLVLLAGLALGLSACVPDMREQPRYEPFEPSSFFPDNMSARPVISGTISLEQPEIDTPANTGRDAEGQLLSTFPISVTLDLVKRGQVEYNVYCSPCHGLDGYGQGMIVQRGFSPPPSFHDDRLRQAPVGHFYDVITNGFGQMYSYAYRVQPSDRWAIIAYIRALQLSQSANQGDVPPADLQKLQTP